MDSEEVAIVRELGKRAAVVVRAWDEREEEEQHQGPGEDEGDDMDWDEERGEGAGGQADDDDDDDAEALTALKQALLTQMGRDEEDDDAGAGEKEEGALDADTSPTTQEDERPLKRHRRNTSSPPPSSPESPSTLHPVNREHILNNDTTSALTVPLPPSPPPPSKAQCHDDAEARFLTKDEDKNPLPRDEEHTRDSKDSKSSDPLNGLAILDAIISVVGVRYGQMDLLGVRERIWGC